MIGRARLRLTLWYAAIFAATLAALGAAAWFSLARSLSDEVDHGVRTVVDAWLSTSHDPGALRPVDFEREFEGETADVFLLVFRRDGALVANPNDIEADEFVEAVLVEAALRGSTTWTTLEEHGDRLRVLAAPILERGEIEGVIVGGRSLAAHDRQLRQLLSVLGVVGVGGLVMAVAGGYVVAGRALRPIESAYERQRAFVGDASHELRSPLAVVRASAELLLREDLPADQRESVQEILSTSIEASDLVEELLALARLERVDMRPAASTFDARAVAAEVVAQMDSVLAAHNSVATLTGPPIEVRGDPADLRRALRAILENVPAHTPPGTAVDVETRADGGRGLVVVRDHGPGVPPAALGTLFEPFTRTDTARTPTTGHAGLGLAIVRRLIARNQGSVRARNHPSGGLEVTIDLRRAN